MPRKTINTTVHKGHRERLRKRFLTSGLEGFEDHQILELLLFYVIPRRDTNEIAHLLLKRFRTLSAVLEAEPQDLESIPGIGSNASAFLNLLPSITRRYLHDRANREQPLIDSPDNAARQIIPLMAGRNEEVFYLLCLDTRNRLLHPSLISRGTVNVAHVHIRHIVEETLRRKAAKVILSHNHPSGTVEPSHSDIFLTQQIQRTLIPIEIDVVDHLIISGEQFLSMARGGLLHQTPVSEQSVGANVQQTYESIVRESDTAGYDLSRCSGHFVMADET
ncbi:MAG: DNA repair protein RadC [Magnetococcales bacterium]|nr:DNA repair protein RadC [Magnetococcales bacterium]